MTEKVKLPKEVADAIEKLREAHYSNYGIINGVSGEKGKIVSKYISGATADNLLSALVNGYEVERTPEDKVRKFRQDLFDDGMMSEFSATGKVLEILNEGVDAE